MKPGQFNTAKELVDIVNSIARQVLCVQRAVNHNDTHYVQILTPMAVVTIKLDKQLSQEQLNTPIQDIGFTDKWIRVAKGLIQSKEQLDVPFARAQNIVRVGESEAWIADKLLTSSDPLVNQAFLERPGFKIAAAPDRDTVVWGWNRAGGEAAKEFESVWTKNFEGVCGKYTLPSPWVSKAARLCFGDKLDGISFGSVGPWTGIHLVSRRLGVVIGCTGSRFPKETKIQLTPGSKQYNLVCDPEQNVEEDEEEMKATVVDPSVLMPKGETSIVNQVPEEVEKPHTVVVTYPEKTESTPSTYHGAPVVQPVNRAKPATPITDDPVVKETTTEPELQTEDAVDTADSALVFALSSLEEIAEKLKTTIKAVKQAKKLHKAELKDASSGKQQNERIAELEAQLKKIKSALGL